VLKFEMVNPAEVARLGFWLAPAAAFMQAQVLRKAVSMYAGFADT
jgi:hypothetical protein